MNWIPVTESKPKPSRPFEMIIVCTDKGCGISTYSVIDGFSRVQFSGSVQHGFYNITHWMPLPPAPPVV